MLPFAGPKDYPVNVTAENHTTPWSVIVRWGPIPDKEVVEKLLGYRVKYQAILTGDEEMIGPLLSFTVRREAVSTVITDLEPYTRYHIWVLGFSRENDGQSRDTNGGKKACLSILYLLFE